MGDENYGLTFCLELVHLVLAPFLEGFIAHGGIGAALISGALTQLMGEGNIWLSVSIQFKKPIYIGDELTCSLTISDIDRRGVASANVEVTNASSEVIISGTIKSMRFVSKK
jgi:acyl dehydratase